MSGLKVNNNNVIVSKNDSFPWKGFTCGMLCALIAAVWILVTSTGVKNQVLSSYDVIALRYATAGILLLPQFFKDGVNIGRGGWIGIILMSIGAGPVYIFLAMSGMSCTNVCHVGGLLPGTMSMFAAVLSVVFLREQIGLSRVIGLLIIIIAVFVLTGFNPFEIEKDFLTNCLYLLSASFLWAGFTVSMKYWKVKPLHGAALVSVLSAVIYLPIYFLFLTPTVMQASLSEIGLQVLMQGVLAGVIALTLYGKTIELLGASRAAVFFALVPGLATLMAGPILNDWPTLTEWISIFVITIGVLTATGVLKFRK